MEFVLEGKSFEKILSYLTYGSIPKSWQQPFLFKSNSNSLLQNIGGPCGLMASVQSRILIAHSRDPNMIPKQDLIEALLDIESTIRQSFIFCVNFDINNKKAVFYGNEDRCGTGDFLWRTEWANRENATLLFIVSLIVLIGPTWLSSYALPDTFITEDGQTNLTLVLLLLSGQPLDSFQDGNKVMGGMLIKGLTFVPEIGFLSIAEGQDIQKSGHYLKQPQKPIWVAYYGGHFTVLQYTSGGIFEYNALDNTQLWTSVGTTHPFYKTVMDAIRVK